MKRLFRHGLTEDFDSHSHHVLMQLLLLFRSQDFQEGMMSFMEKREPKGPFMAAEPRVEGGAASPPAGCGVGPAPPRSVGSGPDPRQSPAPRGY